MVSEWRISAKTALQVIRFEVNSKYRRSLLHQRHPVWSISAKSDLKFHTIWKFALGSYREHYSSDSMGISLSNQTAALVPKPT